MRMLLIGVMAVVVLTRATAGGITRDDQNPAEVADRVTLAVVGGRLVDGHGGRPLENAVVLVAGSRIARIGTTDSLDVPSGVPVVSSEGMTVIPGLIDMHVHFMVVGHNDYGFWFPWARSRSRELMQLSARIILDQGVTTVKDCSGPLPEIVELRESIRRADVPGPRAIVTGPFLQRTNSPANDYLYWSVSSVDDARQKLKLLVDAGVDQIKTAQSSQLGPEIVGLIVSEAHRAGKHVTAHVNSDEDMRVLLDAGVDARDTFEHVGGGSALRFDDGLVERLRASGVGLVPTAIAIEGIVQLEEFWEYAHIQEQKRDLPPDLYQLVRESYKDIQRHPLYERGKFQMAARRAKLRQLHEAGLQILMGTDSGTRGNPHQLAAWREMEILTEIGMTPMEAIRAATYYNARNLGLLSQIGSIAPGKTADMVVVDGDPLTNIRDVRRVSTVIKEGRVVREP
ncbi:MAG TPA: amidohydrolase family protein [Vicinamibacterales bacterium]|nr:amidohydrolase family protein [Vicinamibacterales bacterium]